MLKRLGLLAKRVRRSPNNMAKNKNGFTLVELMVVIMAGFFGIGILGFGAYLLYLLIMVLRMHIGG